MEYYIMKMYLKAKEESEEIEQGFGRYSKGVKEVLIALLAGIILSWIGMVVLLFISPTKLWYVIPMLLMILCFLVHKLIENNDEKRNLDRYANSYEKKLNILHDILITRYEVKTREKLQELINLYKGVVDKKDKEEKRKNTMIITIFSVFAGVSSITFTNMAVMGITFIVWLMLIIIVFVGVLMVTFVIYSDILFDTVKRDYIGMIKDLEELKFRSY